jgi:excisionase family DNA binding protein
MEKATLTVKEAAQVIGVSLPTMYEITEQESFYPLLRLGRKKLILKDRLREWMYDQTAPKQQ